MTDDAVATDLGWNAAKRLIGHNGFAPLSAVLLAFNLTAEDSFARTLESKSGFIMHKGTRGVNEEAYVSREGLLWTTLVLPLHLDVERSLRRFNDSLQYHKDNSTALIPQVASHLQHIIENRLGPLPQAWWVESLAQVLGWGATGFGLTMTQMADKDSMMVMGLACSVLQIAHFWLLGEEGALWGQLIMLLMCIFGYFEKQQWASIGYWFLYPLTLLGARDLHGWFDLEYLPLLGSFLSVFARHQRDLFWLRLIMIFANLPWVPYCIATDDWANLVGMTMFSGLSVVAFLRFHILPRRKRGGARAMAKVL
jgi:hypothetical protein